MKIKSFTILMILGISSLFQAQNYNDALRLSQPGLLSGARALAMGNSYVALSNDFSATLHNPAGLGLVGNYQVTGSFNYNSIENTTTLYNTTTIDDQSNTSLRDVGFVFPVPTFRGSLVFAFGYTTGKDFNKVVSFDSYNNSSHSFAQVLANSDGDNYAYELGLAYFDTLSSTYGTLLNGKLQQIGKTIEDGSLDSWNFGGSIEVAPNLYIGASLNLKTGSFSHNREFTEWDINNIYSSPLDPMDSRTTDFLEYTYNDIFDWEISGWDLNLGFLYKINTFSQVGASIKFPTDYSIKEVYVIEATSDFATDGFFLDPPVISEVEYSIQTPFEFTAGAAFEIADVIMSGQIAFIDYSEMEFTDGLELTTMGINNKDIKELMRGTLNYNTGLEYKLPVGGVKLRGGFMYQQSPYDGDPSEYDRKYLTFGAGFEAGNALSIDVAYVKGWWQNFGDNYSSGISRNFQDISMTNVLVGFTYHY
ncbi:MAG: outer membrane protein transport protein [Melioribacteraceae bacterium]|nr:outer membrane protein transport protein [Melioribacteraceae bacterium]MCF8266138.1 outer membrane protein transport protein [Melioribacteraceae bacterium]MCF8412266.1 outer membrane protein transport protein [Melioribacteraceae bacterium]